jgi:hypothetical protein
MSKEVTYKCNLCNESTKQEDLRGIHFNGAYPSRSFVYRSPNDTATHLCTSCEAIIVRLHDEELDSIQHAIAP